MFAGLVEEIGTIAAIAPTDGGLRLAVRADGVRDSLAIGDSVAVNGACPTAVELRRDGCVAGAVAEPLRRTPLGDAQTGDRVNLERALVVGARLGGHLV